MLPFFRWIHLLKTYCLAQVTGAGFNPAHSSTVCFISLCLLSIPLSSFTQLILGSLQSNGHWPPFTFTFKFMDSASCFHEISFWLKFLFINLLRFQSSIFTWINLKRRKIKEIWNFLFPIIFSVAICFVFCPTNSCNIIASDESNCDQSPPAITSKNRLYLPCYQHVDFLEKFWEMGDAYCNIRVWPVWFHKRMEKMEVHFGVITLRKQSSSVTVVLVIFIWKEKGLKSSSSCHW